MQLKEGTCHTCQYCDWETPLENISEQFKAYTVEGICCAPLPSIDISVLYAGVYAESPHENCPCYKRREG